MALAGAGAVAAQATDRAGAAVLRGPHRGAGGGTARLFRRHGQEPGEQSARQAPARRHDHHVRRGAAMNLTDLTEVLHERAELADSSHEARMAGVRARVSATRRRRAAAGVACVVLALVGIVHAVLPRPEALPE